MKLSTNGANLIKTFEKCELEAYKATPREAYYTIGWGHYGSDVKAGETITQAKADELFNTDVVKFENAVNKYQSTYNFNQNQYDALVSFAYNIGNIDQLTSNGTRDISILPEKMKLYVKQSGVTLQGLVTRRAKEIELFNTPCSVTASTTSSVKEKKVSDTKMPTIRNGSRGTAVKIWQLIVGFTGSKVDGIFGSDTESKTRAFQESHGLANDGIVGTNTWSAGLESVK